MNALKMGDLIQLKKHCKNRNRWAIITALPDYRSRLITIIYLDTRETCQAAKSNIEVCSEKELKNGHKTEQQKSRLSKKEDNHWKRQVYQMAQQRGRSKRLAS